MFAVTALPIALFVLINLFKTGTIHLGILTVPSLSGNARFFAIVSSDFLQRVTELARLLITQFDGMLSNAIPGFGCVYLISMPFLIIGLWPPIAGPRAPSAKIRAKGFKPDSVMFVWFIIALAMALFTNINVNRMNILFLPAIYFIAKGIVRLAGDRRSTISGRKPALSRAKWIMPAIITAFVIYFSLFCWTYFGKYRDDTALFFNESLDSAIKYADAIPDKTIYVDHKYINMPYIHVLFNTKYPVRDFINTVIYKNPGGEFQEVSSFGRYRFEFDATKPPDMNAVYVLNLDDVSRFDKNAFTDVPFRLYHVMVPK